MRTEKICWLLWVWDLYQYERILWYFYKNAQAITTLIELGSNCMKLQPLLFSLELISYVALLTFALAFIFAIICKFLLKTPFVNVLIYYSGFGMPICLTGWVTGYITGLSRVAVIGNVLPACLALLGGINIYVFGVDTKNKVVVGYCVSAFIIMLFLGIESGSYNRDSARESYLKYLSEQELRIRSVRRDLGLPIDIPAWMSDGAGDNK